jgi:hypothetical protein
MSVYILTGKGKKSKVMNMKVGKEYFLVEG